MSDYPREIVNNLQSRMLDIIWEDGSAQQLPHATLRAQCKCTVCQSNRLLAIATEITPDLRIDDIRQIGVYGVQLVFSDGHERGIYPWPYLRELA
ncbi:DUF971 domain-containing protein [Duganella radicis]|uniref:DUF971 domain-containing protein n=1 Tax=Duganella radicis TaxID=551988 RepID=A0A6L6PDT2_9BURK|nr:DUF971 domain-containing protein [Duganella radicis]MTV37226.1 DUF971 domain-containing protein [Duganella radicis]